jgi:hypothetical protein
LKKNNTFGEAFQLKQHICIVNKSYLIDILKTFTKDEWDEADIFLSSDFFCKGKLGNDARILFRVLKNLMKNGISDLDLKKENIYKKVYKNEEIIEGKIEKLMVDLNKIIRNYLLVKSYLDESNKIIYTLEMSKILRRRNILSRYQQILNKLESIQKNKPKKNTTHYLNNYFIEYEKHDFESYHNTHTNDLNIPKVIYALDVFYLTSILELVNRLLLQSQATKIEITEHFTKLATIFNFSNHYQEENPILKITNKIYLILNSNPPKIDDAKDLLDLLKQNEETLDQPTLRAFNAYLRNICIIIGQNDPSDLNNDFFIFQLQREHLEKGYLYYEGKLSPGGILSIVKRGIKFKIHDWTFQVLETHKDLIIGDNETQDYYRLAKSIYLFGIQKYDEALDTLPLSFNEATFTNLARRLELKIYYELKSDLLPFKIDAYKMYVNRTLKKNVPDNDQAFQTNFINLFIQLVNSIPNDHNRTERLIRRINDKKLVGEKEWLIEKVKQLGGLPE